MTKSKKPRLSSQPKEHNVRKTELNNNYGAICWQFAKMDMSGPFSFSNMSFEEWLLILGKMREWETMTWSEIAGNRDHAIAVESLSQEAKKRLIEIEMDDIDEVFSLHLDGKKRLIGIRDRNIFSVLWWDRKHEVCPSHKKHT